MSTVEEIISLEFADFGIDNSQARMDKVLVDANLNGGDTYTTTIAPQVDMAILQVISKRIAQATKITEGGYSVEYNVEGMKAYLLALQTRLGIVDTADKTPIITDKSYLW